MDFFDDVAYTLCVPPPAVDGNHPTVTEPLEENVAAQVDHPLLDEFFAEVESWLQRVHGW